VDESMHELCSVPDSTVSADYYKCSRQVASNACRQQNIRSIHRTITLMKDFKCYNMKLILNISE